MTYSWGMPRGRGPLQQLAGELEVDERSLRRAVEVGALRCRRPSPRRLEIGAGEKDYLRGHWPLIAGLRAALRTEPNVRAAILFGSVARGTETEASDLDLLVELERESLSELAALTGRLEERVGREVQVVRLSEARDRPALLLTILQEGRAIVDRDGDWAAISRRRRRIERQARASRAEASEAARHALTSLGGAQ